MTLGTKLNSTFYLIWLNNIWDSNVLEWFYVIFSVTSAATRVASIVPGISGFTRWFLCLNFTLPNRKWGTSSSCAKPSDSVCRTSASIAILESLKKAFEMIAIVGDNIWTIHLHFHVVWSANMIRFMFKIHLCGWTLGYWSISYWSLCCINSIRQASNECTSR